MFTEPGANNHLSTIFSGEYKGLQNISGLRHKQHVCSWKLLTCTSIVTLLIEFGSKTNERNTVVFIQICHRRLKFEGKLI